MISAAAAQPAGGGSGSAASAAAASAAASSLARHWLVQLLGGLDVTAMHVLTLQQQQPSGGVCELALPCMPLEPDSSVADTGLQGLAVVSRPGPRRGRLPPYWL